MLENNMVKTGTFKQYNELFKKLIHSYAVENIFGDQLKPFDNPVTLYVK
jgi:hypothetical protein